MDVLSAIVRVAQLVMGRNQQLTDGVLPYDLRGRPDVRGSHGIRPAAQITETTVPCARDDVVTACLLPVTQSPICMCSLNTSLYVLTEYIMLYRHVPSCDDTRLHHGSSLSKPVGQNGGSTGQSASLRSTSSDGSSSFGSTISGESHSAVTDMVRLFGAAARGS